MFQLMVVIAEGVFQVWWLKRFFEVRMFLSIERPADSILINVRCRRLSAWSDLDLLSFPDQNTSLCLPFVMHMSTSDNCGFGNYWPIRFQRDLPG